jgi:hypothetical protein
MMKLIVTYLTIPRLSSFMGMGALKDNLIIINDDRDSTNTSNGSPIMKTRLYYLKYLLIEALTIFQQCEDLLLNEGSDERLDDRRTKLMLNLLVMRLSPLIPICISVAENLPIVLEVMTCHILGVRAVASNTSSS